MHAEAQANEKSTKVVDKERYARAAEAYQFYLANFPDAPDAAELRYLRADILYFKLRQVRGRRARVPGRRQDPAGRQVPQGRAPAGDGRVREGAQADLGGSGKREITDSDRLFGEAADLYATLFPNDKEIVTVIYKNGQFFFDYGDYDEAVKRFGLIVERYPDDPNAGAAGDRILQALNKAKDYENIESWARRLKKTKAFASKDEQARLDKLIVGAVMKSGEKYARERRLRQGRRLLPARPQRVSGRRQRPQGAQQRRRRSTRRRRSRTRRSPPTSSWPTSTRRPARRPRRSSPPRASRRTSPTTTRRPALYEQLAAKYPQNPHAADALRSAGVLRQSLGQHDRAIKHYGEYAKRYKDRPDAKDVAFQAAVVREDQKDWRGAAASFAAFSKAYPGDAKTVEALAREADAHLKAGNDAAAKETAAKALAAYKQHGKARATRASYYAAEARYIQGELAYLEYEKIKIAGKPKQLAKVLEEKAKRLEEAKAIYLDVVTYKSPEWATAALLRIGQGYEAFAKAMRNAPVPKDLKEDEKQMYRDELEKVIVVIEDKAIDAYKSGYARALQIGVYNKHTQAIRQALAAWPRTSTRRRPRSACRPAPASRASRWTGSRRCAVTNRSASDRHVRIRSPASSSPLAPARRRRGPQIDARSAAGKSGWAFERRARFRTIGFTGSRAVLRAQGAARATDAGARPARSRRWRSPRPAPRRRRRSTKASASCGWGASTTRTRASRSPARPSSTDACSRPGTIWASSRRRSATSTPRSTTSSRRSTSSRARARPCSPTARACAARRTARRRARSTPAGSNSDPNDFEMRARYSQVLREAGQ